MQLQKASVHPPAGVRELLLELGAGERGFGGTSFGRGEATLEQFLAECCDGEDPVRVVPGFVPQTIFWMIDDDGRAIGMVRARHALNERLLQCGGHVGYYVRSADRRRGCATAALAEAVRFLNSLGVARVLVTASPSNEASNRVIVANGGRFDGQGCDPDSGKVVNRYWIG